MHAVRPIDTTLLLTSALQALAGTTHPMTCAELIQRMGFERTPERLLYAMLVRYRNQHGVHSPIHATGTGGFVWVQRGQKAAPRGHVVR